jgi:hypothetical protein
MRALAVALLIVAALAGCGGGGGGTTDAASTGTAGTGGAAAGKLLTWKENGAAHAALVASAARVKSATSDIVQVSGGEASGTALSFGVAVQSPPLAAGTYTFNGGTGYPIVSMSYGVGGVSSSIPTAISIVFTALGDTTGSHAVGTFTATLPFGDGTTKTITDGKFDLTLTVNSI